MFNALDKLRATAGVAAVLMKTQAVLSDTKIIRLVLEGKAGKEMPDSSIFEFLKKFFAKSFV